jgi:uncharacterized membrane protein
VGFTQIAETLGMALEALGMAIILIGALRPLVQYAVRALRGRREAGAYDRVRRDVGRALLLGLEFLVAGDIIQTVGGTVSFEALGLLAGVVAIRTFLSFTITAEIEGRWPWQATKTAPRERE